LSVVLRWAGESSHRRVPRALGADVALPESVKVTGRWRHAGEMNKVMTTTTISDVSTA
jgi:hypothetical protein